MQKQAPVIHYINLYRDPATDKIHVSDDAFTDPAHARAEIRRYQDTFGYVYVETATTWVKRDLGHLNFRAPTNPQTYADKGVSL